MLRRPGAWIGRFNNMEREITELAIAGVSFQPLRIIPTPQGPVLHMLRADYPLMPSFPAGFGEIYFSEIYPRKIKAWKRHASQEQLFAVPAGIIKLVLFDSRADSSTRGSIVEMLLGRPDHYGLLRIPAGIWYGFQCRSDYPALVCNCANIPHDPEDNERKSPDNSDIPYRWE